MPIKRSSVQFAGGRLWRAYCLRYEIVGRSVVPPKNRAHYFFTALRGACMQLDQRTPAWKIAVTPLPLLALLAVLTASRLMVGRNTTIGVLAAVLMLATFIAIFSATLILLHRADRAIWAYMRRHPRVQMGLALLFMVGMLIVAVVNRKSLMQQMWDDPSLRISAILCIGLLATAAAFIVLFFLVSFCIYLWRCWRTVRATRPPLQ